MVRCGKLGFSKGARETPFFSSLFELCVCGRFLFKKCVVLAFEVASCPHFLSRQAGVGARVEVSERGRHVRGASTRRRGATTCARCGMLSLVSFYVRRWRCMIGRRAGILEGVGNLVYPTKHARETLQSPRVAHKRGMLKKTRWSQGVE